MTSIGVVGTGISGLNLALTLQQAGIDTTVYAEHDPDTMRRGRLANTATRFGPTVARERALGVAHWPGLAAYDAFHVGILGTPIDFTGRLREAASAVDFRVYLPRLLEDYAARGGEVVIAAMRPEDVVAAAARHDLVVVASGRESVNAFFPRDPERSPHSRPQRMLCAVLCHGIAPHDPPAACVSLAPGVGETSEFPWLSPHGLVTGILFEAIPGGPLVAISRADHRADPRAFAALAIDLLRRYAPHVHERIDPRSFAVTGPRDILQGAITPTVRTPYCQIAPGRFAFAIGDAYATSDPIVAQGANLGSASAALVARAICADVAYDAQFCRDLERRLWTVAEPATNFSKTFLMPPPHLEAIIGAANESQYVADAFTDLLAHPDAAWRAVANPQRAARFLAEHRSPPPREPAASSRHPWSASV